MQSRKWIAGNNCILPSSDEHCLDGITDSPPNDCLEEEEEGEPSQSKSQFDIWSPNQEAKDRTGVDETEHPNIWSLILSPKNKPDHPVPVVPYIHPQVKKSAASLSVKSLEICTESLGSETGSDVFSSYSSSETSDGEEDGKEELPDHPEKMVPSSDMFSTVSRKRQQLQQLTRSRSFPPPLPSLSHQNGASLHVHSLRNNGRLVLEAVSVKEQRNFQAQREGGRLVLTLIDHPTGNDRDNGDKKATDGDEIDDALTPDGAATDDDEEIQDIGDVEEEEEEEEGEVTELQANKLSDILNKHPVILSDRCPLLPDRFAEAVVFGPHCMATS
ncbi:hypothetical protein SAY87_016244 [Trapa incisa]|uniref:FAF domain-containing protein n=1 Tax=Trapa incisa TaxID=236973 RepID=A0AAN7QYV0_9MYRT|nr:hypothetical protein SAY87_016244 [Trapa incisa]